MTFTRRFLSDPGQTEILKIEGVVIIDQQPPGSVSGVGSGFVCMVGEYEDGPYGIPFEVTSNTDFLTNFGGFGFTYGGVASRHACCRARFADGQLLPEYWNGNGFIALVNKQFSRLAVLRVDTSVGSVSFSPLAFVTGNGNFEFALSPGQLLSLDIGAGAVSATFNAAAAVKVSAAGAYPTTFVGGEHIQFVIDLGTPQQIGPIDVFFTSADQSQAQVIAKLNAAAGYAAFSNAGGNVTNFTGRVQGTSGNVQVLAQDALVGTKVGFATTVANGTGNVANITKVSFTEVQTIVAAAVAGTVVDRDSNNNVRITATSAASLTVTTATTATGLGFTNGSAGTNVTQSATSIPAGTRVKNGSAVEWVTTQSLNVAAAAAGPFSIKVRPAVDDGTNAGATAGTVTTFTAAIPGGAWSCTNPLPLAAALTEAQLDAAYSLAIDATLSPNAITRQCNVLVSARQSNALRMKCRSNAQVASLGGLFGRMTVVRPPLGTSRANAKSTTTQPGVGAYRDERVVYAFPGVNTFVPQIAVRGLAGGVGFTADGNIDVGFQTWVSSVMSQLAPEENPGQLTGFMSLVNGLEVGNPDVQSMTILDYEAFKLSGIAAAYMDDGTCIIQSGVTSVDPQVQSALVAINRRRMADFIQDSLALAMKPFVKKKATKLRRSEIYGQVQAFLNQLVGNPNQGNQRIDSFLLDAKSGNTPDSLAAGIFRLIIKVRLLPDLLDIVLQTEIGENVDTAVTQLAA